MEFSIQDVKNKHFEAFCRREGINEDAEAGRHLLLRRFVDELEEDWNLENRDKLKKTNCPKIFTAADVRKFADVDEVTDETPQPYKDRVAFAEFLEAGGAQ